ncbi:MAG: hypothetical protein J6J55_01725 [Paludibacteraceae bacterium]|nr:hypothetical protein [Paludibacteraceae bacterium]
MTKQKSTKRALLLSALSLLMCVSMLIGSTFAWFTDSVTSSGNIIKSGTLDVTMEWADGTKAVPADDSNEWTDASKGAIFNSELWEPGYTEVRHIKIANEGTLALKYQLNIIANGEVSKLADVIDVYYVDPAVQVADRTALTDANKLGTLTDVLANISTTASGNLKAGDKDTITLALKMQESAGNEYQDLAIGSDFSIQLLATQLTSEIDSFDDQYDKDAVYYDSLVTNANELYTAVAAASENSIIAIDGNIVLTKALSKAGLKNIKFVAMNENATIDQATYNMHFSGAKVTFEGLTLTHGEKAYGNGGQTSTAFAVWDAKEVNYIDCTFNRSVGTIHAALHNFIGCTFNGVENPDNAKSEYPLYICDGEDYNVIDCVFNCTNRGAILFYNDGGSGVDTLNISNTSFLGDIIADKTAVEIHNNSNTQIYNVNIKDVVVGNGVINGLYRIKPANVGEVNVTVDGVIKNATIVSTKDELLALSAKTLTGNNGAAEEASIVLGADIDMQNAEFSAIIAQRGDKLNIVGNGHKISNVKVISGANDNTTGQASMFYAYPNSTLTISDLTLENITVTADENSTGYAAAVVGYCEGALILNNVDVVNATVTGVKSSGMLVGHLSGSLVAKDCDVSGTVTLANFAEEANGHYAGKYIGTLAGAATLTDCSENVTVSGNLNAANDGTVFGRKTAAGSLN